MLKIWPFLLITFLVTGCMWPSSYSDKKSGRLLDHNGKPLPSTYVFTRVNKECGSLGGRSVQIVKSAYTTTDSDGRYTRTISGTSWLSDMLLASCGGFSFDDFACREGYGCSMIRNDGDFVLEPGRDLTFMLFELPPEIKSALAGSPQKDSAQKKALPGWDPDVSLHVLMYSTKDGHPVVEIDDPGTIGWLKFTQGTQPSSRGKSYKAEWLPPGPYRESSTSSSSGVLRTELFAVGEKNGIMRPIAAITWQNGLTPGLSIPTRSDWANAWANATTDAVPLDIRKRLPSAAPPPDIPPEVLGASVPYRYTMMKEWPPGVPLNGYGIPLYQIRDYPAHYRIQLKAVSPKELLDRADQLLAKAGRKTPNGRSQISSNDVVLGQMTGLGASYEVPLKTAEQDARSLRELGILSQYYQERSSVAEVDDTIAALKKRLEADPNAPAIGQGPGTGKTALANFESARRSLASHPGTALIELWVLQIP